MQLQNLPKPREMRDADCVAKREELRRKGQPTPQEKVQLTELTEHLVDRRLIKAQRFLHYSEYNETHEYRQYKLNRNKEGQVCS